MSAYVVATLTFLDEARYRTYQAGFARIFPKFGGRVLVADESPIALEGSAPGKVVILEFDDAEAALRFLKSPEYALISEDRRAGATSHAVLVRGSPSWSSRDKR